MKSKNLFLLMMIFTAPVVSLKSQGLITLQHNGNASFYTTLTAAYTAAANRDTIIIPGGSYTIGTLNINKRLVIYGAGHHPDSAYATTRTSLTGSINLVTGADSGMIQGFNLTGNLCFGTSDANEVVNAYFISRVNVDTLRLGYNNNSTSDGILLSESVIRGPATGANISNLVVEKCIFSNNLFYFRNTIFNNNFFHYNNGSYYGYYALFHTGIDYCVFNNNFIQQTAYYNNLFTCTNSTFNNNVFYASASLPSGTNSGTNNYFNVSFNNELVNYAVSANFDYNNDYHLKTSSTYRNRGTDGRDIGIYGSTYPYKAGGVPENPHFTRITIPTQNDQNGRLNVNIRVRAEDR